MNSFVQYHFLSHFLGEFHFPIMQCDLFFSCFYMCTIIDVNVVLSFISVRLSSGDGRRRLSLPSQAIAICILVYECLSLMAALVFDPGA